MELDILAFAAHPDDVELAASGTLIKHVQSGKKVGIVDLTRGELGSRGSADLRDKEALASAKILGLSARHNLDMGDGIFEIIEINLKKVVQMIRLYQPKVVLCNSISDRHPDHGRGGDLVSRACFLSGLIKFETSYDNKLQRPHRPVSVFRYIQDNWLQPDFVVDITDQMELKMKSIMAYSSQFYSKDMEGPQTPISSPEFLDFLYGRASQYGRLINTKYGEGFNAVRPLGVEDLTTLL
jgi:bacillithiol biosynthesis deacetylase BshB1